jgi:hypothetical protein
VWSGHVCSIKLRVSRDAHVLKGAEFDISLCCRLTDAWMNLIGMIFTNRELVLVRVSTRQFEVAVY